MLDLTERLKHSRETSWDRFGKTITFYLPGMFCYNGQTGKYPAVSITGSRCHLQCDHCNRKILESMIQAVTPDQLIKKSLRLAEKGYRGILISGGCDEDARLPWAEFLPAIEEIKRKTDLFISIHSGLVDDADALNLKMAGVDQALIDVIGDDETFKRICHVPFGVSKIESAMRALQSAGLPMIPHIVCGLDYGRIKGEMNAIKMISQFNVELVVIVSIMGISGTPLRDVVPPKAEEVAGLVAEARFQMPEVPISLGCARQRGNTRLETLVIDAGANRMALPSEEAIEHARKYRLDIKYQRTCCSVSRDLAERSW